ncbi:MAG: hypothetical protein KAR07_03955 [Spirochaetes bacterium]|nr:hypothetical protein [Spirochaetota bacterium]
MKKFILILLIGILTISCSKKSPIGPSNLNLTTSERKIAGIKISFPHTENSFITVNQNKKHEDKGIIRFTVKSKKDKIYWSLPIFIKKEIKKTSSFHPKNYDPKKWNEKVYYWKKLKNGYSIARNANFGKKGETIWCEVKRVKNNREIRVFNTIHSKNWKSLGKLLLSIMENVK